MACRVFREIKFGHIRPTTTFETSNTLPFVAAHGSGNAPPASRIQIKRTKETATDIYPLDAIPAGNKSVLSESTLNGDYRD
jgi:hypothetical protein